MYALDRLETPSNDFSRIQKRAENELGTSLSYRRIDVRDVEQLNAIVEEIASKHQRLDGLIAAAGIQQETPALDYTAKDADLMMSINVAGCFMTAQAAARQMIKYGNGGSIVMIASMSGTVANRVCLLFYSFSFLSMTDNTSEGPHLPSLQRVQSSRHSTRTQPSHGMGRARYQSQHHITWLHRNCYGGSALREVP